MGSGLTLTGGQSSAQQSGGQEQNRKRQKPAAGQGRAHKNYLLSYGKNGGTVVRLGATVHQPIKQRAFMVVISSYHNLQSGKLHSGYRPKAPGRLCMPVQLGAVIVSVIVSVIKCNSECNSNCNYNSNCNSYSYCKCKCKCYCLCYSKCAPRGGGREKETS